MNAPQPQPAYVPPNNDADHLRLLSIFHYVLAGLTAVLSCFPIIYVIIGVAIMNGNVSPFDGFPKGAFPIEAIPKEAPPKNAPREDALDNLARPKDRQPNDDQPNHAPRNEAQPKDGDDVFKEAQQFAEGQMQFLGTVFVVVGIAAILLGWIVALLLAIAGRKLATRRGRVFCIVVAALSCFSFPLGTALGVFTLIVLMRPSVQALFEQPLGFQAR